MAADNKHQPHVFEEVEEIPISPPVGARSMGGGGEQWTQPPIPGRKSALCGMCHLPRNDRLHIDGETEADAESPNWG
jgi:hypothetical protein